MIPTLHISLLGEFRLVSGETPVTSVDWPRLQSLLAYLVLHHSAPQSRTHLAALLWPDSTDAQAHSNLRTLVTRFRQTFPNADAFLRTEKQTLQWKPDVSWMADVLEFERAVAQAEDAKDATEVRMALEEAVASYHGDLLPSCYDEWILPERDRLRQHFQEVLERLIGVLEDEHAFQTAIQVGQRLQRHDPLHEATYRHLMRLYAVCGDRAAALRTYHTCASVFERELAVEPSRSTREAYTRLLHAQEPAGSPETPLASRAKGSTLIGRAQQWTQLQAAWRDVMTGQPHLVVLTGEAGIGKTRLAEELLTWVERQGIATAYARCYATAEKLAYAPVASWLRTEALRPALSTCADVWLTEVARLVPELLVQRPDLPHPGPLTEDWQRQRFSEALTRVTLGASSPLLLVLDDLHWCDQETLAWLHSLLHFDPRARVLIAGTMRTEEMYPEHPLAAWLLTLRRDGLLTESELGPLDASDTTELAEQVARRRLPPEMAVALYRETEGNPLFVVETVRAGVLDQERKKQLADSEGRARERSLLPPTVQAVLATRLAQLSPGAREVTQVAAVIGRAFTFEVLTRASGRDEDSVVRGLDELWQRRIVREQYTDAYDFSHDKLREQAYAALSHAQRRVLHRRVLGALQSTGAPSAALAYHALQARQVDLAFRYRVAAGDEALQLFAVHDALDHYEQAQQLMARQSVGHKQHANQPVEEIHHLYVHLGRAYELNNDKQQAHAVYTAMLAFARIAHAPQMECAALNRLATLVAWESYDTDAAVVLLQEALNVAEQSGDSVGVAETEWSLAQMQYYASKAQEALPHAERALALARAGDLKELIARSLNVLAYTSELLGNWEEVAAHAEEARVCFEALGNRAMEIDCLALLARAHVATGHPQEGIRAAQAASAISREIDNIWGQAYSAMNLAHGLREIGAYAEALEAAQQGVTIAHTLNVPPMLIFSHFGLGLVQGTLFALDAARTTLLEAVAINAPIGSPQFTEIIATTLCLCHALGEQWTEAQTYALQAARARQDRVPYSWHFTAWYETEALLRTGAIALAEEGVQRFGACVGEERGENRRYRIGYLRALAVLETFRGEMDQAIAHLQTAARLAEEIGLPGERWQIEAALAERYQQRGDFEQASEAFARAAEIIQTLAIALRDEHLQQTFLSAPMVERVLTRQSS